MKVKIFGQRVSALVDSGTSRIYMGPRFAELFASKLFDLRDARIITLPNEEVGKISSKLTVPLVLEGTCSELAVQLVGLLAYDCVFGMNAFNMIETLIVSIYFKDHN